MVIHPSLTSHARRLVAIRAGVLAFFVAFTGVAGPAIAQMKPVDGHAVEDSATKARDIDSAKRLGLTRCRVTSVFASVSPAGILNSAASATISLELTPGTSTTFTLDPYSLRSADYKLVISDDTGDHELPAALTPASTTYHGASTAGDEIWASIYNGQVNAVIVTARNPQDRLYIQPEFETIASEFHAVYAASDVAPHNHTCGNDLCPTCRQTGNAVNGGGFIPRGPGIPCRYMRVNVDSDFPMYQQYGNDVGAVVRHVDAVMLGVSQLYLAAPFNADPRFTIVRMTVRTSNASDPYNAVPPLGGDVGVLLSTVTTVWPNSNTRDLTHLFTGRDTDLLDGASAPSVIGLAYVGAVCTSSSAGLSQNIFGSNIASAQSITAHEMGHNFGMSHDASGAPYIMAPSIASPPNTDWSPTSITVFNSFLINKPACGAAAVTDVAPDGATTIKNRAIRIDVLANDGRTGVACPSTVTSFTLPGTTTALNGTVAVSSGTGPGGRNEVLYTPPLGVDGITDSFNYVAAGVTAAVTIDVTVPRPPDGASGVNPGLTATYYNTWPNGQAGSWWIWETPPADFSIYSTIGSPVTLPQLNYTSLLPGFQRGLSAVITGYVRVPSSGYWTFTVSAGSSARVYIGGDQFLLAGNSSGGAEVSATRALSAGLHTLRLDYHYGPNTPRLILSYASDTQTKIVIPATSLFRNLAPNCAADFNNSGALTVQDIFDFLAAWFAGTPTANFNGVNGITVQDIFDFLSAWFAGC